MGKNELGNAVYKIPDIDSERSARPVAVAGWPEVRIHTKGKGVLVMPVPALQELKGLAKGAQSIDFRDRKDRY